MAESQVAREPPFFLSLAGALLLFTVGRSAAGVRERTGYKDRQTQAHVGGGPGRMCAEMIPGPRPPVAHPRPVRVRPSVVLCRRPRPFGASSSFPFRRTEVTDLGREATGSTFACGSTYVRVGFRRLRIAASRVSS